MNISQGSSVPMSPPSTTPPPSCAVVAGLRLWVGGIILYAHWLKKRKDERESQGIHCTVYWRIVGNVVRGTLCGIFTCKSTCKISWSFSLYFFLPQKTRSHWTALRPQQPERGKGERESYGTGFLAMLAGIKPYHALWFLLVGK